jgi:N-carbamoyl-L-amino-acid hydrolase
MIGSLAFVGQLDRQTLDKPDDEGVSVASRLRTLGGRPDEVRFGSATAPADLSAFLELHIEQGPILENTNVEIGIVEVVTGRTSLEILCEGSPAHAGTTPMDRRADALVAAARVVLALEHLARSGAVRVATVGHLHLAPNMRNVIPGLVKLGVDLRDTEHTVLQEIVNLVDAEVRSISTATGVDIRVRRTSMIEPTRTDPEICNTLERAARKRQASAMRMASGAGHDSQIVARSVPTGLLFVPSVGGTSHSPLERTRAEDLVRGADVLLHASSELLGLKGD